MPNFDIEDNVEQERWDYTIHYQIQRRGREGF
jgi:hypothetical protein